MSFSCEASLEKLFFTPDYPISGSVDIGSQWLEIIPPKPLKSIVKNHFVSVEMTGVDIFASIEGDSNNKTLVMKDGRKGKIEAFLFDDKGQDYELKIIGSGRGINLGRALAPRDANQLPSEEPDFPYERVYTKLKIRSEVPIYCEKIEWDGNTSK